MKQKLLTLFVLVVCGGCASRGTDSDVANLTALQFAVAQSAAIAGLKGESKAADAFHGYLRVTEWRPADAATTAAFAALTAGIVRADLASERRAESGDGVVRLHSFCFNPGYAVRLASDRGPRDFLICFECDELYVVDERGHAWQHHLDKTEAAKLTALLGRA